MRTRIGIGAVLAVAAVAAVGCGAQRQTSSERTTAAQAPAFDAQRTRDLVPLTRAQAARMADRIALVTARGSRVVEGAPGTPFTRTTFAVEDVLKGRLPRTFVLQVIGGRLGDRVVDSPVPPFARAGRYVLFLGRDNRVGPTIIPQAIIDASRAGPRLGAVLRSIKRDVRATGGSR
jgi:hypothetical protein